MHLYPSNNTSKLIAPFMLFSISLIIFNVLNFYMNINMISHSMNKFKKEKL